MAKKQPQPIFPVKHEFYDALNNFIQKASALHIAVDVALTCGEGQMPKATALALRKASYEFKKAWAKE